MFQVTSIPFAAAGDSVISSGSRLCDLGHPHHWPTLSTRRRVLDSRVPDDIRPESAVITRERKTVFLGPAHDSVQTGRKILNVLAPRVALVPS
jgi:hypothetical protein